MYVQMQILVTSSVPVSDGSPGFVVAVVVLLTVIVSLPYRTVTVMVYSVSAIKSLSVVV